MCPTMSDDGRRYLGDIGQQDTKLSFEICPLPLGGLGHAYGGHHRSDIVGHMPTATASRHTISGQVQALTSSYPGG